MQGSAHAIHRAGLYDYKISVAINIHTNALSVLLLKIVNHKWCTHEPLLPHMNVKAQNVVHSPENKPVKMID